MNVFSGQVSFELNHIPVWNQFLKAGLLKTLDLPSFLCPSAFSFNFEHSNNSFIYLLIYFFTWIYWCNWLIKLYRFQIHNFIIYHLCIVLCVFTSPGQVPVMFLKHLTQGRSHTICMCREWLSRSSWEAESVIVFDTWLWDMFYKLE